MTIKRGPIQKNRAEDRVAYTPLKGALHVPLTDKEERDLISIIQDESSSKGEKDLALQKLIQGHLPLLSKITHDKHWVAGGSATWKDLFMTGVAGLVKAAERFDLSREVRFSSYFINWVKLHQRQEQQFYASVVDVPRRIWSIMVSLSRMEANQQKPVTYEQFKTRYPYHHNSNIVEAIRMRYKSVSLDDLLDAGDSAEDLPEIESSPLLESILMEEERSNLLMMVNDLPQLERDIIFLAFGLDDKGERTHAVIAEELGVAARTVQKYKNLGLAKLATAMERGRLLKKG